jgi:hypothetical protein
VYADCEALESFFVMHLWSRFSWGKNILRETWMAHRPVEPA